MKGSLDPILETDGAQVSHLKHLYMPRSMDRHQPSTSRRSVATVISDPDNGILFVDDWNRVVNPRNEKTPPPPMWGEVLEEDLYDDTQLFYDHNAAVQSLQKQQFKMNHMMDQDRKIRQALEDGRPQDVDSKRLKRKVIYVYEDEK
jgi:hypothetical protein